MTMRNYSRNVLELFVLSLILAFGGSALADDSDSDSDRLEFSAKLSGFKEAPPVLSDASGRFRAALHGDTLEYRMRVRGFDSFVRFAHIHFGQRGVNGGVIVFLCDSTGGGPAGTPECPQGSGKVTGELTGRSVVGPDGQGISPGDFRGFIRALKARRGYVNVHSDDFPSGELRGDVKAHD